MKANVIQHAVLSSDGQKVDQPAGSKILYHKEITCASGDSCCQTSVQNGNNNGGYFYLRANEVKEGEWYGCPLSQLPNTLRCSTALRWCQPSETLGIQGVVGRAYVQEGDCSPGTENANSCRYSFGERTLVVRKAVNVASDIIPKEDGMPELNKEIPLISKVVSAKDGYFVIALSPGDYSLLIKFGEHEYCARYDCNFTVKTGSTTKVDALINRTSS